MSCSSTVTSASSESTVEDWKLGLREWATFLSCLCTRHKGDKPFVVFVVVLTHLLQVSRSCYADSELQHIDHKTAALIK